jgi:hypothetical protein
MVKKPEIQYIDKFYVHGSEARVLELKPKRRIIKTVLPLSAPDKTIKLAIDPVAVCGIVVAVALLVLMVVGTVQYFQVCRQYQAMMDYVVTVQNENVELRESYRSQINLDEVRERALELGMISREEAEHMTIRPVVPVVEPEMTAWDEFIWLCKGLFA